MQYSEAYTECPFNCHVAMPCTPFEQIGINILGQFSLSADWNKWVIVVTHYSRRYADIHAIPRATASEVAQFFMRYIVLRYGAHSRVVTDRGTAFMAQLVKKVFVLSNTRHRKTTAYPPPNERAYQAAA